MSIKNCLLCFCLLFFAPFAMAQNPILKGYADAHMKIWNGKMYVSAGKDKSPEIKGFAMPNWSIYSSADLVNWKLECDIMPEETFINTIQPWFRDIKGNYLKGAYYVQLLKME